MNKEHSSGGLPNWIRVGIVLSMMVAWVPFGKKIAAQSPDDYVYLVRQIEMNDLGLGSLGGVAYSPQEDALLALQATPANNSRIVSIIDRNENVLGSSKVGGLSSTALEIAFNRQQNSLFVLDPVMKEVAAVKTDARGRIPANVPDFINNSLVALGIPQIQGMDIQPVDGRLFLLDPPGRKLVIVTPDGTGSYDGQSAVKDKRVKRIDLKGFGAGRLQGLAYHPGSGNLFTMDQKGQFLYEFNTAGDLLVTRDVSSFLMKNPKSIVVAPSGDDTDDPAIQSIYIADTATNQIIEASITQAEVLALPAASPVSLVNTILASNWNPPSPDTSGIDYDPFTNQLKVSDSEVEEMTIFQGVNLFQSSLSGSLQATCLTTSYSKEPSGLSVNTTNGNLFISDDGRKRLHEIDLGPDRRYCTSDDRVRTADTSTYGANDPEGVEYGDGRIFFAGGKDAEVYVVSPGANGVFDGKAPSGDDVVDLHFDTAVMGLKDPEGIAFHPDRHTLFIVSRSDSILVETSQTGTVLRVFNIGFLNAVGTAGLGIGPGSQDASAVDVYVTQRGVDNNNDPRENDGKIFELNIGDGSGPQPTPTATPLPQPTPTPGPTPTPTDGIFSDGFESGSFSVWSSSTTGGGDLSVSAGAALRGGYGLQALINDNTAIYVTDNTPNAEPRYRARFFFDPNAISMTSGDNHFIFQGVSGTSKVVLRVQFRFSKGSYQLRAGALDDSSTWNYTGYYTISDQPNAVEMDWQGSSSPGANNGGLTFWINGVQQAALTGIGNYTFRIDSIRLGPGAGVDSGTRGSYYLDDFVSRRQTYIGP